MEMDFSWSNIDVDVPNKNKRYGTKRIKLVSDACGNMQSGLLAVMGPSGSGKTTLMNTFVSRMPSGSQTSGKIMYNGKERTNLAKWQSEIGYVDQDDTIFSELTAYQTVEYAAKFRLKNHQSVNLGERKLSSFSKN